MFFRLSGRGSTVVLAVVTPRIASRANLHTTSCLGRYTVSDGFWLRDYKPRPYPTTEEDRYKAAIKYGMRPEDYAPMPRDTGEDTYGEYPHLGNIGYDNKDPYEDWTDFRNRRHWGEQVPIYHELYRADRMSNTGFEENWWKMVFKTLSFYAVLFGTFIFAFFGPSYRFSKLMMPKQFPYDFDRAYPFEDPARYPILNYTFEPTDDESAASRPEHQD